MKKTRYVVMDISKDNIYCIGIYKDIESAVGRAYLEAMDFIDRSFSNTEDVTMHEMEELDAENGYVIKVSWRIPITSLEYDGNDGSREYYVVEYSPEEEEE